MVGAGEHEQMAVRLLLGELVAGRVEHGEAGQVPVERYVGHCKGDQLVELVVQRPVAVERHRQHGRKQPLVLGRGGFRVAEQPLEGGRIGNARREHPPVGARGGLRIGPRSGGCAATIRPPRPTPSGCLRPC